MIGQLKLAPSILTADFGAIGDQVRLAEAAGADYIHVDVMDGRFVPNITIGPLVVAGIRRATSLPLDVHLMIVEPERHVVDFVKAGASLVTVHVEATRHLHRTVDLIKRAGARAGVALNPATPLVMLDEMLPEIDLALIMSVNPGWGGQEFRQLSVDKIRSLRQLLDQRRLMPELEVDGGVNARTVASVVEAGATVLVAGSAIYNERESVAAATGRLQEAMRAAIDTPSVTS